MKKKKQQGRCEGEYPCALIGAPVGPGSFSMLTIAVLKVGGLRCRVQGSWCRVRGVGFGVWSSGCEVQGVGRGVQGSECRVQGEERRVQDVGFRV